jgi:ATP-dependent helicase/DNAse subunit B
MAEHIRNELARSSHAIRPNRILTLAKFLEPFAELKEAPASLVRLLVAQLCPGEFPGYHRALASLIQEKSASDLPPALARISEEVDHRLTAVGRALRQKRLSNTTPTAAKSIIIDGFFTFGESELELLEKLAKRTHLTVTLPDWSGSEAARERLLAAGFEEKKRTHPLRQPAKTVLAALSIHQEVEQIALQILQHTAKGRPLREIGILLRVRNPYAEALETAFARFGIPARFHFTDPVSAHPAIQYISGLIRASFSGWDHEQILPFLRMPVSGLGATAAGDRLDFQMRQTIPAVGLRALDRFLPTGPQLALFQEAESVHSGPLEPLLNLPRNRMFPSEWAQTLKSLKSLIPNPAVTDRVDHTQLQIWRSTAAALAAFDEALDTTAEALANQRLTLAQFWPHAETALSVDQLRVPDRRRDVVNVLDVYEARQWELPIVFVCGLTERHFPQHHRENPLFPDPRQTQARQEEEKFLFELATTRATEETILSYPRFNDKGEAQLRSFFLTGEGKPVPGTRILPKRTVSASKPILGSAPELKILHATLSSSAIEAFQQCPFQFFATKTLRLRSRPEKPRDRLNVLLQGTILHRALAEGSLGHAFDAECDRHNVPRTYRTEAVRLELQRHYEAFLADTTLPFSWPRQTELQFEFSLTPELAIRGRIDRLDLGPDNQAIVIDYKYSAPARVKERLDNPIQGGLYLLAAERQFGFAPAGMLYCGLRQSVAWEGWQTIQALKPTEFTSRSFLRELMDQAEQQAIDTYQAVVGGNRQVRPVDRKKCRFCDAKDICRVDAAAQSTSAGSS